MKIKQISATKLLGIFDHTISLNQHEQITIIYGKNGFGKTTLLRLINSLFNHKYSELKSIPFEALNIEFDDGSHLLVHQASTEEETLSFNFVNPDGNQLNYNLATQSVDAKESEFLIEDITSRGRRVLNARRWTKRENKSKTPESLESYYFMVSLPGDELKNGSEWLGNILDSIDVSFLEFQHFLNSYNFNQLRLASRRSSIRFPSVTQSAKELARDIKTKLAEYNELAQSLDQSFPLRVIQQQITDDFTTKEILRKLNELEQKRSHLINIGLLSQAHTSQFHVSDQIDENAKKVLSVYVADLDKKLSVFESLAVRVALFIKIINQKFSYKQISINQEQGFAFSYNGNPLSLASLSSGEQHELIILYELLFKAKPKSLVLIDGPELSLHIDWIAQFLEDLQEIKKIVELDILIATQSPYLINERWDLTIQLQGPA